MPKIPASSNAHQFRLPERKAAIKCSTPSEKASPPNKKISDTRVIPGLATVKTANTIASTPRSKSTHQFLVRVSMEFSNPSFNLRYENEPRKTADSKSCDGI